MGSSSPLFHVVLHEPEIPNNTGNIGRTCVATGCSLHLIKPLGFDTSEKECRRAGLDYWPRLGVREHESWDTFQASMDPVTSQPFSSSRLWLFTTKTTRVVYDAPFMPGDVLLFGKETRGLPEEFLAKYPEQGVRFPMMAGERSLNLATAVCAAVYEGVRQLREKGFVRIDEQGRIERSGVARPLGGGGAG